MEAQHHLWSTYQWSWRPWTLRWPAGTPIISGHLYFGILSSSWISWIATSWYILYPWFEGRGKSRGRWGWISQYLPSFGGVRTFSHHQSFYREWIRKSFPVDTEGLTVLKSILPCWWWENALCCPFKCFQYLRDVSAQARWSQININCQPSCPGYARYTGYVPTSTPYKFIRVQFKLATELIAPLHIQLLQFYNAHAFYTLLAIQMQSGDVQRL